MASRPASGRPGVENAFAAGIDALGLVLHQVKHDLNHPRRGEYLTVVGDALFGLDEVHAMALAWGSAIYGNGVCSLSTTSRSTREPRLVYRALLPAKDSDSTDSRDQKDHTLQKYELSTNISRGLAAHLAHSLRLLKPHGTCGSHQTR